MGKTALGWAFAEGVSRAVWMEINPGDDLESFADSLAHSTGQRASDPDRAETVAAASVQGLAGDRKLLVRVGYAGVDGAAAAAGPCRTRGCRGPGHRLGPAAASARAA